MGAGAAVFFTRQQNAEPLARAASAIQEDWIDANKPDPPRRSAVLSTIVGRLHCCGIVMQRVSLVGSGVQVEASGRNPVYGKLLARLDAIKPANALVIVTYGGRVRMVAATRPQTRLSAWVAPELLRRQ